MLGTVRAGWDSKVIPGPSCASKPNLCPFRTDTLHAPPLPQTQWTPRIPLAHIKASLPPPRPVHFTSDGLCSILPPTAPWQTQGCVLDKPVILGMLDCVDGDWQSRWGTGAPREVLPNRKRHLCWVMTVRNSVNQLPRGLRDSLLFSYMTDLRVAVTPFILMFWVFTKARLDHAAVTALSFQGETATMQVYFLLL